jgi:flagellar basal body rod protein FlgF
MKCTILFTLATMVAGHVLEQRACAANNCNRQVTGTRAGLPAFASRSADCSSFLAVTVSPTTTRYVSFPPFLS